MCSAYLEHHTFQFQSTHRILGELAKCTLRDQFSVSIQTKNSAEEVERQFNWLRADAGPDDRSVGDD